MARTYRVRRVARHDARPAHSSEPRINRVQVYKIFFLIVICIIIGRLFSLMIIGHGFYIALASDSHEMYAELIPERGSIYLENNEGKQTPLALNRDKFIVFADTRSYDDPKTPLEVTRALASFFHYGEEKEKQVLEQLSKVNDGYEQTRNRVK